MILLRLHCLPVSNHGYFHLQPFQGKSTLIPIGQNVLKKRSMITSSYPQIQLITCVITSSYLLIQLISPISKMISDDLLAVAKCHKTAHEKSLCLTDKKSSTFKFIAHETTFPMISYFQELQTLRNLLISKHDFSNGSKS